RVPAADGEDGRPATLLRAAQPLDASRDAPVGRGVHDQVSLRAAGIAAEHDASYITELGHNLHPGRPDLAEALGQLPGLGQPDVNVLVRLPDEHAGSDEVAVGDHEPAYPRANAMLGDPGPDGAAAQHQHRLAEQPLGWPARIPTGDDLRPGLFDKGPGEGGGPQPRARLPACGREPGG